MKGGYPLGVHARCRTLHQLAVFAAVIGEHNQELSERFLLHSAVEDASFVDSYQKNVAGKYGCNADGLLIIAVKSNDQR